MRIIVMCIFIFFLKMVVGVLCSGASLVSIVDCN